ncbi:D-amino acid dehydrogenase [Paraburkholderia phosphatilytica]|uniref:D-amino acid dehydrogenase n=1 Tax=Paraburkholderia phosphatilytica TaxID=2282883 RepID=UPI000E4C5C27|nr:D-amino acid dehydrogenase [Paraburkholderia phosphatilytica]
MRICVLGGGVIGITTAYWLAREGHEVTVIEQHDEVGHGTSFANGGQLSYSYVAPLADPSVFGKLPHWLLSRTAPLRFTPSFSVDQWRWCIAFLRECTAACSRATTRELLALGFYSQAMLRELLDDEAIPFAHRESGKLVVYRDPAAFAAAERLMRYQAALGCEQQALNAHACVEREPALGALASQLAGGIYTRSEETGDCLGFTRGVARAATERYGARLMPGTRIDALDVAQGRVRAVRTSRGELEADHVVVALGNGTRALLKPLGLDVPLYPLTGYSLTLPIRGTDLAPSVSVTDAHHKIVYARLGDSLRIAGMVDVAGTRIEHTAHGNADRLALLARQARETFPHAGDYAAARGWSGARPATPSGKPILGATPLPNLWLNVGHGALGFTLACASARLVTDLVCGRTPALALDPFSWAYGALRGASRSASPVLHDDAARRTT